MTTEVKHDWAECVGLDQLENDGYTKGGRIQEPHGVHINDKAWTLDPALVQ